MSQRRSRNHLKQTYPYSKLSIILHNQAKVNGQRNTQWEILRKRPQEYHGGQENNQHRPKYKPVKHNLQRREVAELNTYHPRQQTYLSQISRTWASIYANSPQNNSNKCAWPSAHKTTNALSASRPSSPSTFKNSTGLPSETCNFSYETSANYAICHTRACLLTRMMTLWLMMIFEAFIDKINQTIVSLMRNAAKNRQTKHDS